MDLFFCWLVAPLGLLLTTVGLSLLIERPTAIAIPGTVRPLMGMATAIVLAQFGTASSTTAKLTLPAILALAIAGLLVGGRVADRRPSWTEVAVGGGVFLLLASPFLVSGEASWAGFIKLDDTATWMALTDHVFEYGRGVGNLPPSTHAQVIVDYLGGSYPIGGFVPAALMSKISGQDVAFTMQPSMAFAGAALALGLLEMVRRLVRGVGMAVAIAILGSLSSLLVGYYLWGGVKELVMAALLPLAPLLAGSAVRDGWPRFIWAPLAVAVTAAVVVLGPGGAIWVGPALLPAAVVLWSDRGGWALLQVAWRTSALSLLLALPVIFTPSGLFDPLINGSLTESTELGNLNQPLSITQVAGIWPSIDFRANPHIKPAVLVLAGLCLAIAVVTVIFCLRSRDRERMPIAAYVAGGAVGAAAMIWVGSPWVDAKAMAMLSPAILTAALLGLVMLGQRSGFRFEAVVLGSLVAGTVIWSAFLAYQGAWIAPRAPQVELEEIGDRFAGQGPALSTEAAIYGPRHFLRKLDAQGAGDRRTRPVLLNDGTEPEDSQAVDLDEIQTTELDFYNLLVVRRSPAASRPPASFTLVNESPRYDVWKRESPPGTLVEHLSLGTPLDAGAIPPCADVRRLAEEAGSQGKLIAANVGAPVVVGLSSASKPGDWEAPSTHTVAPSGSGRLSERTEVPGGEYELWLGGVVFGGVDLSLDGEEVASERMAIENQGALEPLARVKLSAGKHRLELDYSGADLHPGSALHAYEIGPLELDAPKSGDLGTLTATPANYRKLCGRRWDWLEAYS
jgi:hypothetical protein